MASAGTQTIDRRSIIKKGAFVAGAAWAAPTVLTRAAGAQTQTCYFAKMDAGNSLAGNPGNCASSDPSNGACPPPGFATSSGCTSGKLLSFSVTTESATATVATGCNITQMQVKAGTDCNATAASGTTATVTRAANSPAGKEISHVSVVFCCDAASS